MGTVKALRGLAGDALIAVGVVVRGPADHPVDDPYVGAMESDGPDQTKPVSIPRAEVRSALDELPDSELLGIAAFVIAGWKPLLLRTLADLTDIDVLVAALRDRRDQFRAVEGDAAEPFLTPEHLHAHVRPVWTPDDSVQTALDATQHTAYLGQAER